MGNKNVLNDKELQQVNGGMVPFLEDVSGSEIKWEKTGDEVEDIFKPGDYTAVVT